MKFSYLKIENRRI